MSEVIVDQFGSVQIPSVILVRLGLGPGCRLVIETDEQGSIKLSPVSAASHSPSLPSPEPVEPQPVEENDVVVLPAEPNSDTVKLIRKNGVLVASVEPVGDLEHAVEFGRQARIEKLMEGFTL